MKLGTVESIKFKKLKMRLGLTQWQAIGLLESLWMFVARNAPLGDIGKHSNEDIAVHLEWLDSADDLISTLVDCKWLDESEEHRLIVHDWEEHLPLWLAANLKSHGKKPISAKQPAKQVAKQAAKQPALGNVPEHPAIFSSDLISSDSKEKNDFSFAENTSEGTPEGDRLTMPGGLSAWSEQFWAIYPKKVKRNEIDDAMDRAIIEIVHRKSVCDDVAFADIMEAARAYAESPMGRLSPAQSIPSPALWLKQGCYRDDRQLWQTPLGDTAKPRDPPRPKVAPLVGDQLMAKFGGKN